MKRLWAVAIVSLLTLPALAQIRGVPASVTSITPTRTTSGIPASVTSLGPNGYGNNHRSFSQNFNNNYNSMCSTPGALIPSAMGCTNPYFTNPMYNLPLNTPAGNTRSRANRGRGGYYPVYVPYTVPVVVEGYPEQQPDMTAIAGDESEEPPAMTVFERRPVSAAIRTAPPIDESRVYHPAMTQPNEVRPEAEAPPIVLIYNDGHQREVQNYAIMGNYLYDIGTFIAQKIPLAQLNLKATAKANEERGVEFSLPAGIAP